MAPLRLELMTTMIAPSVHAGTRVCMHGHVCMHMCIEIAPKYACRHMCIEIAGALPLAVKANGPCRVPMHPFCQIALKAVSPSLRILS